MIETSVDNPLVRIDSEVTRRVRQHARAHMHTEVCGVLIGKLCGGIIEIDAPIEAFNATQAGAHVTFTQAAWETIYRVKDKDYPQERIVGWYHSHPGFGVFLSEHDTFIHRNFFSSPDQVAWVYDPHSDEEGCFAWVNGSIHRLASIHVADSNGECPQQAGRQFAGGMQIPDAQMPRPPTDRRRAFPSGIQRTMGALVSRLAALGKKLFAGWVHLGRWLLLLPGRQPTLSPPFEPPSGQAAEPLASESRQ